MTKRDLGTGLASTVRPEPARSAESKAARPSALRLRSLRLRAQGERVWSDSRMVSPNRDRSFP
jgi:hypothetical protein